MKTMMSFLVLTLLLGVQTTNSQVPSYEMKYKHVCSERLTATLTSSPPLEWNMPLTVFQSYFVIDSLCKRNLTTNYVELYTLFSNEITPTLTESISKYLYQTIDYDPLLFYRYVFQGEYLNDSYINSPRLFYYLFNELRLNKELGLSPFLAISAGIYHIRVTSVWTDTTSLSPSNKHPVAITCIEADVLTTLKGEELTTSYEDPETRSTVDRINFSYANYWETKNQATTSSSDRVFTIESADSNITVHGGRTTFGTFHSPEIGDEYILFAFLNFEPHTSSNGTVYNVWPCHGSQPEGGLFPIENGNVLDTSNYFGWGSSVEVTTFLNNLGNHIVTYFQN